jgi:hypothetical protein
MVAHSVVAYGPGIFSVVVLGAVVAVVLIFVIRMALAPKTRRLGLGFLAATFAGLAVGPAMAYIIRDNPSSLEPLPAFPGWILELTFYETPPMAAHLAGAFVGAIVVDGLAALLVLLAAAVAAARGN